jgi:hypothetical protein
MNSSELTLLIAVVAITVADVIKDNDELAILASAFTQLGYTLDTIAEQRILEGNTQELLEILKNKKWKTRHLA